MSGPQVTLGVSPARRAELEDFLREEGLDWQIVAEGTGTLNIRDATEGADAANRAELRAGGRIDCSTALAMAEELRADSRSIGRLLNLLGIRIRNCQLGCFP